MEPKDRPAIVTNIRIRPEIWQALRALAELRALRVGGRPSASAVVAELVTEAAAKREAPRE